MEITLQIFSGSFTGKTVSFEKVEQKLLSVLQRLPVSKVIMGWSPNRALYEKTARLLGSKHLSKRKVDFYLWFPVFSETGALKSLSPLVDFHDRRLESASSHVDEDFSFCCPTDPQNIENILGIFEEHFASIPLSGIFLDKIRYPSFAQGSVFTCFCRHCQVEYEKENFNTKELVNVFFNSSCTPLGVTEYHGNGEYEFEDPVMSRFFSLKAGFVYQSMQRICNYFREKGLAIGFDVFAPFLSPFAGQDLLKLSSLCDFMKPMMYRLTNAPAGLPFEMEALLRGTGSEDEVKRRAFHGLLGFNLGEKVFDLDFTVKELRDLVSASSCPIHVGVEINRIKNLA